MTYKLFALHAEHRTPPPGWRRTWCSQGCFFFFFAFAADYTLLIRTGYPFSGNKKKNGCQRAVGTAKGKPLTQPDPITSRAPGASHQHLQGGKCSPTRLLGGAAFNFREGAIHPLGVVFYHSTLPCLLPGRVAKEQRLVWNGGAPGLLLCCLIIRSLLGFPVSALASCVVCKSCNRHPHRNCFYAFVMDC